MFYLLQEPGAPAPEGNAFMNFLPFILIIVVFYFFMIRPQQKRQKELNNFRDNLKKGDSVMTSGGVYATVHKVVGNKIELEIAQGVIVTYDKSAILSSMADKQDEQK